MGGDGDDKGKGGGGNNKGNRHNAYSIYDNNGTIEYRGPWVMDTFTLPSFSTSQTSHSTSDANASMSVPFVGSQIQVLGMIPPGEGTISANYSIDGREPMTRIIPGLSQDIPVYFQMLYTSPILKNTNHTLTVQMVEIGGGRNYSFQQFKVLTPRDKEQQTSSKNSDGDGDKGKHGNANSAAIVGGVLGSVIILLLAFLFAFYLWRKRRLTQMSKPGLERLPPTTYYARPISNGEKTLYMLEPASVIDTNSRFTFAALRNDSVDSRVSWVPVSLPPTVPDSALVNDRPISDWSDYKQQSVIVQPWRPEVSRFSPHTSTPLSPTSFGERTPRPAPSRRAGPPSQIETLTTSTSSSLRRSPEIERF